MSYNLRSTLVPTRIIGVVAGACFLSQKSKLAKNHNFLWDFSLPYFWHPLVLHILIAVSVNQGETNEEDFSL